jgi:hypothetical protein
MAVYVGSRYETADIDKVQVGPDSYNVVMFGPPPQTAGVPFNVIVMPGGMRLETLAQKLLGDAKKWWVIADLNPEIDDFFRIPMGALIRVPVTPGTA